MAIRRWMRYRSGPASATLWACRLAAGVCCVLSLALLVGRHHNSGGYENHTAVRPPSSHQQAQLEFDAVAAALRRLSTSSDPESRQLAAAAGASLARAAGLLHLATDGPDGADSATAAPTPGRVCTERYVNATVGYPFFYDGWRAADCPLRRRYGRLLTVLLTLATEADVARVQRVHAGVRRLHVGVPVLVAAVEELAGVAESLDGVEVLRVPDAAPLGEMLNRLVDLARTDYVLVAAHLTDFTSDANLERLLREADRQNASVVAGATRQADGRWSHGCYQTSVNNYTLRYLAGYHRSRHECLLCDHVTGPFVARTDLLRRVRLAARTHLLFEDLFLRVRQADSRPVLVCPDVMFHVRRSPADGRTRARWLSVTRRLGVDLVQPPGGAELRFSCRELRVRCDEGGKGRLMSPCCRRQLLRLIHAVMVRCQETNAICELQEGTLLGALKMATILPWERDADIAFSSADFKKLENATYFFQEGFELKLVSYPYCCHENRTSGGVVQVHGEHWHAELWGQHWTDTEKLRDESGQPPTRVLLDGRWYPAPRNPGLYVRNRYGREVYRHAEHWLTTGKQSGWAAYNTDRFTPCPVAGHHSCLDQYLTDGVLQFDRP